MHSSGFIAWALGLITLFVILRLFLAVPHSVPGPPSPKTERPLKPRTPRDCPVCQHPHPTPRWGHYRKPGVPPWSERHSPRPHVCTTGYACPRPTCDYSGNTDSTFHALVGNGVRGQDRIQQFKCQACGQPFSSRLDTALYRLHTSARDVAQVLQAFHLGWSVADVQGLFGHSEATLCAWLARAGLHAEKVHHHFFDQLSLGHLQFDELYTTLRHKTQDLWVWVAFDPQTKLIPALDLGPRTQEMAYALVHAVTQVLAPGCLPVCTSDGLNLYFYALTAHFGAWLTDPASGQPKWQVALALLYGQVKKSYRRRKLAKVERRMQLGQREDLQAALQGLGFTGSIHTAFVERLNLTLRHALAALTRRSWATAQLAPELKAHLEWWRAYYHFCRLHQGLRLKLETPQARQGRRTPRRYLRCAPTAHAGHGGRINRSPLECPRTLGLPRRLTGSTGGVRRRIAI